MHTWMSTSGTRKGRTFTDARERRAVLSTASARQDASMWAGATPKIMDTLRDALDEHDMGSHSILSEHKVRFAAKARFSLPGRPEQGGALR
ncbi:MAG: hypothetical protein MZU91_13465 [Desulfosudis oleivorans]|nr:hypothetical protein [Desulfosudis oleivorans]